jgi:hypothetical protein
VPVSNLQRRGNPGLQGAAPHLPRRVFWFLTREHWLVTDWMKSCLTMPMSPLGLPKQEGGKHSSW